MIIQSPLTSLLNIQLPIIMAPMFLVSNEAMIKAALDKGVMGVFPSLNYRQNDELSSILDVFNKYKAERQSKGNYGINLIVQKTNPLYRSHLDICIDYKVPFYITSLGSPEEVIRRGQSYGAKVFCDVTNSTHAEKCASLGCDGFIAVGQGAGGHAGPNPLTVLIASLQKQFPEIPVIAAGGIANGAGILSMLALGAAGVSVGTRFIASEEASVPDTYKQAVIDSKMDDIVMTEKLSGTPCTIINTPYAKKIGYTQNGFEKFLSNNPQTKKYFKMLVQVRGLRKLENAVKKGNYKNLWCAGKSVELIDDIKSCSAIIDDFKSEMELSLKELNRIIV